MKTIISIVEGPGDVSALPVLLTKINDWETTSLILPRPKNANGRPNILKESGLERFLELARREPQCDGVLVLLDADEDCAMIFAQGLAQRASVLGLPFPVAIVCAKCEYETWFLASLETIAGEARTDIPKGVQYLEPVEERVSAKGWLKRQMPRGCIYKEMQHQAKMTSLLEPGLVRAKSRSFRRLEHALQELLSGEVRVTPLPE